VDLLVPVLTPLAFFQELEWPVITVPSAVTSRNLRVVRADDENNLLLVRGAVPGPDGAFVIIRRSAKKVRS
jgi:hypothetical protein